MREKRVVSLVLTLAMLLGLAGVTTPVSAESAVITDFCDEDFSRIYSKSDGVTFGTIAGAKADLGSDFDKTLHNNYLISDDGEQFIEWKFDGDIELFRIQLVINREQARINKGMEPDADGKGWAVEVVKDITKNIKLYSSADGQDYQEVGIQLAASQYWPSEPSSDAQFHVNAAAIIEYGGTDDYSSDPLGFDKVVNVCRLGNTRNLDTLNGGKALPEGTRYLKLTFNHPGYGDNVVGVMRSFFKADVELPTVSLVEDSVTNNTFDLKFSEPMDDATMVPANISITYGSKPGPLVTNVTKQEGNVYRVTLATDLDTEDYATIKLSDKMVSMGTGLYVSNPELTIKGAEAPDDPSLIVRDLIASIRNGSNHAAVDYFDVTFNKEIDPETFDEYDIIVDDFAEDGFAVDAFTVESVEPLGDAYRVHLSEAMEAGKPYKVIIADSVMSAEGDLTLKNTELVIRCIGKGGAYQMTEYGTDLYQASAYQGDFAVSDVLKQADANTPMPTVLAVPEGDSSLTYEFGGSIDWYYFQFAINKNFTNWSEKYSDTEPYVKLYASADGKRFTQLTGTENGADNANHDFSFYGKAPYGCAFRDASMVDIGAPPAAYRGSRIHNHPTYAKNLKSLGTDIRYLKLEFSDIPTADSVYVANSYVAYNIGMPIFQIKSFNSSTDSTAVLLNFSNMMDAVAIKPEAFTLSQGDTTLSCTDIQFTDAADTAAALTFDGTVNTEEEFFVTAGDTVVTRAQEPLLIQSVGSLTGIDDEALQKMDAAYNNLDISIGDVTGGIPLDTMGMNGATITWASSDPSIIDEGGNVYPTVGVAHDVTMTATISCEGMTRDKEFPIHVPAVQPYAIKGIQVTGEDGIVDNALVGGKTISAVKVKTFTGEAQPVNLLCALYEQDKLVKLYSVTAVSNAPEQYDTEWVDVSWELPESVDNLTAKIMAWDGLNTLKPLAESYLAAPLVTEGITIYMAGDSTMQTYAENQYPWYGWGQVFQKFFDTDGAVTVYNNEAMGGRSSKSFIRENRLGRIIEQIKPGDYLFVQFGHNDGREEYDLTTSLGENGSYTKYLQIYADLAESKGANVVWLSSIPRATLQESDLEGYPEEMIAYAQENAITLVDVYHTALTDFRQLEEGGIQAENLYLYLPKHEADPRTEDGGKYAYDADLLRASEFISDRKGTQINDRTHINFFGADVVAQIAAKGLIEIGHPLSRYVNEGAFFDVAENVPRPLYEEIIAQ